VADYSIAVARNALTYNLPAKLAIETVDVLKRFAAFLVMKFTPLFVFLLYIDFAIFCYCGATDTG
jgi:hypothetical protein